jgi:hypothetical protein
MRTAQPFSPTDALRFHPPHFSRGSTKKSQKKLSDGGSFPPEIAH